MADSRVGTWACCVDTVWLFPKVAVLLLSGSTGELELPSSSLNLDTVQYFNLSSSALFLCSSYTGDWQCSASVPLLARYLPETFSQALTLCPLLIYSQAFLRYSWLRIYVLWIPFLHLWLEFSFLNGVLWWIWFWFFLKSNLSFKVQAFFCILWKKSILAPKWWQYSPLFSSGSISVWPFFCRSITYLELICDDGARQGQGFLPPPRQMSIWPTAIDWKYLLLFSALWWYAKSLMCFVI